MASYLSSWSRLPYPLWGRPLLGKGRDTMFLIATLADATQYLNFQDLMGEHSEIAFSVFGLPIRWYALAYLAGIFVGYWYLLRLIAQPGAPMARRHADAMVFYAMLGLIVRGRLGYFLFFNLGNYLPHPLEILTRWAVGMVLAR